MEILVVGAGLSGATIARVLADNGYTITLIERRDHVAGNAFDFINSHGIRIHKYGPHLFHTSDAKVVGFLSRFTEWIPYQHRVKAKLEDGRLVTLPVNRETAHIVGEENILDVFYRPYTKKMWGVDMEELDSSVLQRVEVRSDLNDLYFPSDSFQALPAAGYTSLVEEMLKHRSIKVQLCREFETGMEREFGHTFNSMSIDEYFGAYNGLLPYRSMKFHHYDIPIPNIFPVAVVNFTHSERFTRATEWKNFPGHGLSEGWTSITVEEPCDFRDNDFERYYPVKDSDGCNRALYQKYNAMVPPNMTFIGRCGLYVYLDMHQAVSSALATANRFKSKNPV